MMKDSIIEREELDNEIERLLKRLGIDTMFSKSDYFDIIDYLFSHYKVSVLLHPNLTSNKEEGLFTYSVADCNEYDLDIVSQEMRYFPTSLIALKHGITEALAYVLLAKDSGIIVAIDGYPACGKSTIAKRLAQEVGYLYIDSGAMYRAAALYFKRTGKEINEENVKDINISFRKEYQTHRQLTILNGENVEDEIRTLEISKLASEIGVIDCVRFRIGDIQRRLGRIGGVVMDGRDIGTVVFPNAQLKLFLMADRDVRADRRWKELGTDKVSLEEVKADLEERDWRDIDQFEGKRRAEDATVLNNTNLTEEEQYDFVLKLFNATVKNYRSKQ